MGFAHSPGDLDDPFRRLPEAQDDFRIAATEVAVRIELCEPEVLIRQVPEGVHRLADGDLPPLEIPKERLHPTPGHGPHRICSPFSSSRTGLRGPPRLISPRVPVSPSSTASA